MSDEDVFDATGEMSVEMSEDDTTITISGGIVSIPIALLDGGPVTIVASYTITISRAESGAVSAEPTKPRHMGRMA